MMNRISKFWMKMRSVLLSSPSASGSSVAWHRVEHENTLIPQDALGSGDRHDSAWLMTLALNTRLLIGLLPLSLATATSVPSVPWATGSTPSLHLCGSYHPQTATLPWSLSNHPNTLHSPVPVSGDSVLLWNADPLSILRDSPLLLHISLSCSPTRLHAPEEHVIFSSIFQNTIILGFQYLLAMTA